MSIASLEAQIAANNLQISRLEQECDTLTANINRMYGEEEEYSFAKGRFDRFMTWEHDKAAAVQSLEGVHIAQGVGKDLARLLSGQSSSSAIEGFSKIGKAFERRIDESQERLRQAREEIRRLQGDNASCHQQIRWIQEEERREAARQAAARAEEARREAERRAQAAGSEG